MQANLLFPDPSIVLVELLHFSFCSPNDLPKRGVDELSTLMSGGQGRWKDVINWEAAQFLSHTTKSPKVSSLLPSTSLSAMLSFLHVYFVSVC